MLDLSKKDPAKAADVGYTFEVLMPDGSKTDAKITVRGANSATVKNHARKIYQEYEVRKQQAKRRGKDVEEPSLDEAEEMIAEVAAVRIIGWEGIGENSKEVAFSKEEAVRIMKTYPFIREQVMEASDNIFLFRTE